MVDRSPSGASAVAALARARARRDGGRRTSAPALGMYSAATTPGATGNPGAGSGEIRRGESNPSMSGGSAAKTDSAGSGSGSATVPVAVGSAGASAGSGSAGSAGSAVASAGLRLREARQPPPNRPSRSLRPTRCRSRRPRRVRGCSSTVPIKELTPVKLAEIGGSPPPWRCCCRSHDLCPRRRGRWATSNVQDRPQARRTWAVPPASRVIKCKDRDRYYVFVDGKPTGMACPTRARRLRGRPTLRRGL